MNPKKNLDVAKKLRSTLGYPSWIESISASAVQSTVVVYIRNGRMAIAKKRIPKEIDGIMIYLREC